MIKMNAFLDKASNDYVKFTKSVVNYANELLERTETAKAALAFRYVKTGDPAVAEQAKRLDDRIALLRQVGKSMIADPSIPADFLADMKAKCPSLLVEDGIVDFDDIQEVPKPADDDRPDISDLQPKDKTDPPADPRQPTPAPPK